MRTFPFYRAGLGFGFVNESHTRLKLLFGVVGFILIF